MSSIATDPEADAGRATAGAAAGAIPSSPLPAASGLVALRLQLQDQLFEAGPGVSFWRARESRGGRERVVRVIDAPTATHPRRLEQLHRERALGDRLENPLVIRTQVPQVDGARIVQAVDPAPARPLAFDPGQRMSALRALLRVAEALAQCHALGHAHGELAQSSLLATSAGDPVICGLGSAGGSAHELRQSAARDVWDLVDRAAELLATSGGPPARLRPLFDSGEPVRGMDPMTAMAWLRDELREALEDTFPWPATSQPVRTALRPPTLAVPESVSVSVLASGPAEAPAVDAAPASAPAAFASPPAAFASPPAAHANPPAPRGSPPAGAAGAAASIPILHPPLARSPAAASAAVPAPLVAAARSALPPRDPVPAPALAPAPAAAPSPAGLSRWLVAAAVLLVVMLVGWMVVGGGPRTATPEAAPATAATAAAPEQLVPVGPSSPVEIERAVSAALADAEARLEAGEPDVARAWFEHALSLDPSSQRAQLGLERAIAAHEARQPGLLARLFGSSGGATP